MAFADGELQAGRHEQIAQWLASHPDGQTEIEDFRRLGRIWQQGAPEEPAPLTWATTLARIETHLPTPQPVPLATAARRHLWTYGGLAAAAVLGLVLLGRSFSPVGTTPTAAVVAGDDEPFPVAQAHEINIVRMEARDADALVGHPPLTGNLIFAGNSDVHLVNVRPLGAHGRTARMEAGQFPMIVVGPAAGPDDR
jgi:anti-sigma factor RsiW